ncbi:MAG TPA: phosphate ABC transporter permease subunit PstC [Vicinamibacterales bacterium]|nr:phosphate ABC transporter permease subunit PstC [Vicinamibacterales bacterium]
MESATATAAPVRPTFAQRLRRGDQIAYLLTFAFAGLVLLLTVALAFELFDKSAAARHKFGWSFLFSQTWNPVTDEYGALGFIYGTVVTSALALLLAVPLGVAVSVFLAELAPRKLSELMALLVDLLAAVPSVIYGLIGIYVLVPLMRDPVAPLLKDVLAPIPIVRHLVSGPAYGVGYLTAGLVLAVMIVPFIVSVSREVLLAVPREQREAALALGSTRWETTSKIVLPYARVGITGGVFLALGRALGETMAVTMVIGNRPDISTSLLAPGYSMAAVIANEFNEAAGMHMEALIEIGLTLFLLTMIINALAQIMILLTTSKATRHA